MYVIGTAGHVDHGKSALIRALTGIDPDRLEEEKRRGLTIDLGFAWLKLPSGREVGIVDVPGHERFIKNMLAGAGAINVTLFVVAANEGWKPQSQEHLDILDLLEVKAAIGVITKIDTVDSKQVDETKRTLASKFALTTLGNAPLIGVSSQTGEGIAELIELIDEVLARTPPAPDEGRPRLWIDRVFTMKGSGTVVTGTLLGGSLATEEEVEVLPGGQRARIRGLQSHNRKIDRVGPGNRTAANLSGLSPSELERGDVVTRPGTRLMTKQFLASLRLLPGAGDPTERGAFKVYSGSAEREATVRFVPGETEVVKFALISLSEPAALEFGDRFVLRESGRRQTLGGGRVLEVRPSNTNPKDPALARSAELRANASGRADYLRVVVGEEGHLTRQDAVLRAGTLPESSAKDFVQLADFIWDRAAFDNTAQTIISAVQEYQMTHPLEDGIPLPALRARMQINAGAFDEVIQEMIARELIGGATAIKTPDFRPDVQTPDALRLIEEIGRGGASPPTAADLSQRYNPALLRALIRSGQLVEVGAGIIYPAEWIDDLRRRVAGRLQEAGPFSVAEFRDMVGTTRKYAIPLLEYLDQIGFTRREGDLRTGGPRA